MSLRRPGAVERALSLFAPAEYSHRLKACLPQAGQAGLCHLMIQVLRESKRAPADVADRITRAGGVNLYGRPNFRVVWGWSRLTWIGGKWTDRDPATGGIIREAVELRRVPKYLPHDRWHLERWLPPALYGPPERWYEYTVEIENGLAIPALGPYPREGEYEHCLTLEGPRGEFLPLSASAVEWLIRAIEFSRAIPSSVRRRAALDREAKKDADYESWAYDRLDDAVPAFHAQPFVVRP